MRGPTLPRDRADDRERPGRAPWASLLLVFLLLLLPIANPLAAQEQGTAAPDSAAVTTEKRAAFLLPDVLVEGEDLSRLTGGIRLLDIAVPGVRPTEEPVPVDPGPTRYRRRIGIPFRVSLPAPAPWLRTAGFARIRLSEGPGGSAALLWAPHADRLLWGQLSSSVDRIPGRRQVALSLGGVRISSAQHPTGRLAVELGGNRETWDPVVDSGKRTTWTQAGEMRVWRVHATGERLWNLLGRQDLLSLHVDGGEVCTRACRHGSCHGASGEHSGRWTAVEAGFSTAGPQADLRPLLGRDSWLAPIPPGRFTYDLRSGFVLREVMGGESDAAAERLGRWQARFGVNLLSDGTSLIFGVAGGGEGKETLAWPWVELRRFWPEQGFLLGLEMKPQVTFAEEIWATPERLSPAVLLRPRSNPIVERPSTATLWRNTSLRPQEARPRISAEALWMSAQGWMLVEASVAQLEAPFNWQPDSLGEEGFFYAPCNASERRLWRLAVEAAHSLSRSSELHWRYRWIRVGDGEQDDELLFLAEHELRSSVRGRVRRLVWGLDAHLRGSVETGVVSRGIDSFLALSARLGLSFQHGTLFLVGENLLGEEIADRPAEGIRDCWFGLEWQQTVFESLP